MFANRDNADVLEGSVQQAWCEPRARQPSSDESRQCRLRGSLTSQHRPACAEGQITRQPVQYRELLTAVQTQRGRTHQYARAPPQHPQLEYRHNAEQTEWQRDKGQPSRRCSQMIPRSFRPTRGRVSGQHAQGFLTRCRLVEKKQNTWYHIGKRTN